MRSLAPSHKSYVVEFVKKGEEFTIFGFLEELRTAKVEPIEAEIIDPEGIYDIQFMNVFHSRLLQYCEVFDTYLLFYENRTDCA